MASEDKRCALMRQTWYEAARRRMKDGARLAFYEMCFDFEFYNRTPDEQDPTAFPHEDALLMFDMVRDALERDAVKAENIALRNRRNGMNGGRPRKASSDAAVVVEIDKPKETQENPENPNGFFGATTTLHYTTLQTKNKSLSLAKGRKRTHKDIDKYEFFGCMFVFFYSGAADPFAETEKFYNYYTARDWQLGRGQHVRDKVALAKTWEIKECNPDLITARKPWSDLIAFIDPEEPELLTDFVAFVKDDENKQLIVRCRNGNRLMQILEGVYLKAFSHYIFNVKKLEGYQLTYEVRPD